MTKKIGIFGGSFNPLHNGHINSITSVLEKMNLDELRVVPAYLSPSGKMLEGPSAEARFEMVQKELQKFSPKVTVSSEEIERRGVSYTIDSLKAFKQREEDSEFYLIIGLDQFSSFDIWKNFEEILRASNLVVTSRPGADLPQNSTDCPAGVQNLISNFENNEVSLSTDKKIYFVQLEDLDTSATKIRRDLRRGESVKDDVPTGILEYIKENKLYEPLSAKIKDYEQMAYKCADILFSKNASGVMGFDLREMMQPTEFTIIASGNSTRHTSSLADNMVSKIKDAYGVYPQGVEGMKEGRWVVLDYGSLIVHLFYEFVRHEYRLEDIWKEGLPMKLSAPPTARVPVASNS